MTTTQKSDTTSDDSNDFQPITDEELGLETDENEVSVQGESLDEGEPPGSPTLSTSNGWANTPAWSDRPITNTRSRKCSDEPLDDAREYVYGLDEPIASSTELISDERYLNEDGEPLDALSAVSTYLARRLGERTSAKKHDYEKTRNWTARKNYNKGKSMGRLLLDRYENPTVALLSLRLRPSVDGRVDLLEAVTNARGNVLDALSRHLDVDYEYLWVYAGTSKRATPHLHIIVYCNGDVDRDSFKPAVQAFVRNCEYADSGMSGHDLDDEAGAISLRGNGEDTIPRVDDSPAESQAGTYVLTQLAHLGEPDTMAQDELLHAVTVDASAGDAFYTSMSEGEIWGDGEPADEAIAEMDVPVDEGSEPLDVGEN